jgi:hypothetical protein
MIPDIVNITWGICFELHLLDIYSARIYPSKLNLRYQCYIRVLSIFCFTGIWRLILFIKIALISWWYYSTLQQWLKLRILNA